MTKRKKLQRYFDQWLVPAAIVFGLALAVLLPTFTGSNEMKDFTWAAIRFRFYLFVPICLVGLCLLLHPLRTLLGLLLLIAVLYVEENWRGKRAWNNYRQAEEARGEKFDFASFIPPSVPADHNFAFTPIVASCYLRYLDQNGHRLRPENTNIINRMEMKAVGHNYWQAGNISTYGLWPKSEAIDLKAWQDYYRLLPNTNDSETAANEFPLAPSAQTPAADILLALSRYDSALEELRQAANQCRESRFPLNYTAEPPSQILLPHLYALSLCQKMLQLRAVAELENNQNERALADIKLMLRLSDTIRNEPGVDSHLSRLGLVDVAIQPIWEGMAKHRWSEAQLAELEQCLDRLNLLAEHSLDLRSERAEILATIEFMRRNPARAFNCIRMICYLSGEYANYAPPREMDYYLTFWQRLIPSLVPNGWFYQNEKVVSQLYQSALPTSSGNTLETFSAASRRAANLQENEHQHLSPYNAVAVLTCPGFQSLAKSFLKTQSSLDLARVACALERYHLTRSDYPETLDVLAAQFMDKVPTDVFNGRPLHYRRLETGGFKLYSVGWNETDDGGVPGMNDFKNIDPQKGDWVWQYPAKTAKEN